MRIRVFGFSSDSNRPPSRYSLISAILSCLLVGAVMVQQVLKGRWDNLSILFLAVAFAASVYHLIYQARGLYRQKKKQSEDAEFMHKAEEPDYELPQKGVLNEAEMKHRIALAKEADVPMTNYGVAIAHVNGILKRSLELFPEVLNLL